METRKEAIPIATQVLRLFFGPPSLILTTCAGAPIPRFHLFPALMRKLCLSSSLLLEACSAASYLVPSSPSVRGTKAGRVSAKADQLHDRCRFPCLSPALLREPLFPGTDIEPFVFERGGTKKKKSHYGDRVFMVQPGCLI